MWIPRLARLLLLAYPPVLRREFGDEIVFSVSESWQRRRGWRARSSFILTLVRDFLSSWPLAWRGQRRSTEPPRRWRFPDLAGDVRGALRLLTHAPLFTAGTVLTLALGIGAVTAIFSLADATLLRPLPIPRADRIVQADFSWGHADFRDLAARQGAFSDIAAWTTTEFGLEVDGRAVLVEGLAANAGYFRVAALPPLAGRTITEADDRAQAPVVAVISERLWTGLFGADPAVIGRAIRLNQRPVTIVGILPRSFRGFSLASAPEIFVPLASVQQVATGFLARPGLMEARNTVWLQVAGRLRDGVTSEQAALDVDGVYRQLHPPPPDTPPDRVTLSPITVRAIGANTADDLRRFVRVLGGATLVTLLLACATVANLLLVRAERRQRELAVRAALGAGRLRMFRMLMSESLMIGVAGAALGLGVASLALRLLGRFTLPGRISIADLDIALNPSVLVLAIGCGLITSVLFGMAPWWHAARVDLNSTLRDGSRGSARQPLRSLLVTSQVALCVLLLGGSLVFGRAVREAFRTDLGFDTQKTSMTTVNPTLARYGGERMLDVRERMLAAVRAASWVESAGWSAMRPLRGRMTWAVSVPGYTPLDKNDIDVDANVVSTGYFESLSIPLLAGRTFEATDRADGTRVAVVSAAMAERYWPGKTAVGQRFSNDPENPTPETWLTVVGVVGDVRRGIEQQPTPMFYVPDAQHATMLDFGDHHLMVRSAVDAEVALRETAAILQQVDAAVPVTSSVTLRDHVGAAATAHRLGFTLFALFAGLAVVLTTFGVYAVVTYAMARRTREIGIRMALGAGAPEVLRLVVRQGLRPTITGLAIGGLSFWLAGGLLERFALSLPTFDVVTMAVLGLGVAAVTLTAMAAPAARALRVDPAIALRNE